jgi:hypothetical protein
VLSRLAPTTLALLLLTAPLGAARAADSDKVSNIIPFDLAVCFLQATTVNKPVNQFALSALWAISRPLVLECLTDARVAAPGKSSAFKLTLSVSDAGYSHTVESDGLLPAAKKCIDDAVARVSPPIEALPAGSKPVTFTAQVPELPPRDQVRFGINEFSDVAGTVRLAMPMLCACFEPFRSKPDPAPFDLKVQITRVPENFKAADGGKPAPVEVTVAEGPPATIRTCVADRLAALKYNITPEQVIVPYRFLFVDAVANSSDVAALPDALKFAQLEAMSGQAAAATELQLARQVAASAQYNDLVKVYQGLVKSSPKKATAMVSELTTTCKELLKQDDRYISTVEAEAKLQQDMATLVASLKTKDPSWAETEVGTQKTVAATQALLAKARELRVNDEKACPKVHY